MCGASQSSRPHITWVCEHTADLRAGLEPPNDRAEERLFCKHVPLLPAAPLEMDLTGCVQSIEEAVYKQLQASTNIYVATDGGSKDDVGAFGVVVSNADLPFASGDGSEDQSPFKQELNAILYTVKGMSQAAKRGAKGSVCILTDCQAAILAVHAMDGHTACPCLVRDIRQLLQQASHASIKHTWIWVPSHGKSPKWTPPSGHCANHLRALNAYADEVAANALNRRLQGSPSAEMV